METKANQYRPVQRAMLSHQTTARGRAAIPQLFFWTAFHPPQSSASEMALTGAPCCFIFQASLFKANGKLRGNYVYNWGVKLWPLHSAWNHKAHFSPNKLCFCKTLHRGRAKFWPWQGGVPAPQREAECRQKEDIHRGLTVNLTVEGTQMKWINVCSGSTQNKIQQHFINVKIKSLEWGTTVHLLWQQYGFTVFISIVNILSHLVSQLTLTTTSER